MTHRAKTNASPRDISGFTMVELIIVVTIAGVLAVLAIPSFTSFTQNQRVKNASFEIYALFSVARSEAIKRNANVTVAPVMVGGKIDRIEITTAGGTVLHSKSMPKGVGINPVPGITYKRTGRATVSGTPTFQIDVEGATTSAPTTHVRCITLGLSGMPQTRLGACS
jgi:type IV fimbrial biogenesis protein FimT